MASSRNSLILKKREEIMKFKGNKVSLLYNICISYIANNIYLYKNSGISDLPVVVKELLIDKITRKINGFTDDLFKLLLHKNLDCMIFSNSTVTNLTLKYLANECFNLNTLDIKYGIQKFTTEGLLSTLPKFTQLHSLRINNSDEITDVVIQEVGKNCPKLVIIDIGGCKNITDESLYFIKDLNLTQLNLSNTQITDKSLKLLSNNGSNCGNCLNDLNISYCLNITSEGLKLLDWNKIEYIGFDGCNINDDLEFLQSHKNLKFIQWTISN